MKGKDGRAREHLVPLSSTAQEVIASLPRYRGGKYLFSFNAGGRPVAMASPAKRDLDRRMLRTLKAMARRRGEDHHAVTLPNWINHDLRRVVRSGSVGIARPAQRRGGRARAQAARHRRRPMTCMSIMDEKREALELWAQRIEVHRQPGACQGHQAAEAAAMINADASSSRV